MGRQRRTFFFALFLLTPLVVLGLSQNRVTNTTSTTKKTAEDQSRRQSVDYSRYFTEQGPSGKWFVAAAADVGQRANNEVPILLVIVATNT